MNNELERTKQEIKNATGYRKQDLIRHLKKLYRKEKKSAKWDIKYWNIVIETEIAIAKTIIKTKELEKNMKK